MFLEMVETMVKMGWEAITRGVLGARLYSAAALAYKSATLCPSASADEAQGRSKRPVKDTTEAARPFAQGPACFPHARCGVHWAHIHYKNGSRFAAPVSSKAAGLCASFFPLAKSAVNGPLGAPKVATWPSRNDPSFIHARLPQICCTGFLKSDLSVCHIGALQKSVPEGGRHNQLID